MAGEKWWKLVRGWLENFREKQIHQKLYATFVETCDWKIHAFFLCKKTRTTSRQLSRCQGFIVWWVTWMGWFFSWVPGPWLNHPMKVWFIIDHTPGNPITFFHSFSVGKKWSFPRFFGNCKRWFGENIRIPPLRRRICHPFWGRD